MQRFYCDECGTEISGPFRLQVKIAVGFDGLDGGYYESEQCDFCSDCLGKRFGDLDLTHKVLSKHNAKLNEVFGEGL